MTYEQALRICAQTHRENGQEDIAELFDEAAENEAHRKKSFADWTIYGDSKREQSEGQRYEDWLKEHPEVIEAL